MQQRQEQLTADAAVKLALWKSLWERKFSSTGDTACANTLTDSSAVDQAIAAHVRRVALPAIQRALPRRIVQPCCLTGACVPRGPLFTHAALHPGRADIRLTHPIAVRDESCWCVAHFAAAAVPQPAALSVRRYRATEVETRLPHQGLRCLLKHVRLHHIEFMDVPRWQDAQAIVAELASLLLRQGHMRPSTTCDAAAESEEQDERLCQCTSIKLSRVPTPGLAMSRFLQLAAAVDQLHSLTLENSGMDDLHTVSDYVRRSRTLRRLDLSANHHLTPADWAELGQGVSQGSSVHHVGVSACGWGPAHLEAFLSALRNVTPRQDGLVLDASRQRGLSVAYALTAMACVTPEGARPHLTGLFLNELEAPVSATSALADLSARHPEVAGGAGVSLFFSNFTQLCRFGLAAPLTGSEKSALETSVWLRVLRGVGDRAESVPWKELDLSSQALSQAHLKRLFQGTLFVSGAALNLGHVRQVADAMGKLPGLSVCIRQLSSLDLSACQIGDAAVTQLAAAMEKSAPLSLQTLILDDNPLDKSFPFLFKALRAHCVPHLHTLRLSATRLPVRPMLTLLEQISHSVHALFTNATAFADSTPDRTLALTTIAKRQRGDVDLRFTRLDWWCLPTTAGAALDESDTHSRELQDWLQKQTAVRLIRRTE